MTAEVTRPLPPQNAIVPTEAHPLYFLHIPKTAGTTLYNAMDDRFEVPHICPDRFLPQMLKRDPDSLTQFRFFRGHFGYSLKNFVDRPLTYITVLRDPVDRCISQYEDVRRVSNNFLYKRVNEYRMTFADFARDSETQIAINNLQARNLAFDWMPEQMDNFNLIRRGIAGTSLGIPDDELLDIAKERLRQCAVVGVVERFQDTLDLLAYRFCWYPITTPRRLNQSTKRLRKETLDAATLDAVREKNQVDEALYRYAVELFETQFDQMVTDLGTDLGTDLERDGGGASSCPHPPAPSPKLGEGEQERFDVFDNSLSPPVPSSQGRKGARLNVPLPQAEGLSVRDTIKHALIQRYGEAEAQQSAFASVVTVAMSDPAVGDNWYAREGLEEGCTPFRWMGPGTVSTVYVPLGIREGGGGIREEFRVQVYVVRAIAADILDSLSLQVNGTPVPLTMLTRWEDMAVLQGIISGEAISAPPALTCLSLAVNRTESMQVVAPHTPDPRQVGVAVSRILLFPIGETMPAQTGVWLFPENDALWSEVRAFVQSHVKAGEAIAAPKEFWQPFPAQFMDITRLTVGEQGTGMPTWAIVAKHLTQQIPSDAFRQMVATLRPVFSNQVFVVLSSRGDLPTVPYFSDAPWSEAVDFLAAWLKSGERLVAPKEFLFRLPEAEVVGEIRKEGLGIREEWVVVHKGQLAEYSDGDLEAIATELRPVFANLVFVIFSSRTVCRRVPFWSRDMRPFWKVYFRRRGLKAIQQIIQLP